MHVPVLVFKRLLRCPVFLFLLLTPFVNPLFAEPKEIGILVLAHGGSPRWNAQVKRAVGKAHLPYPTQIAFGMGMSIQEVENFRRAVEELEAFGVKRLLVIPLLVSSHSSVYRQYGYLLGLRSEPSWSDPRVDPIALRAQVTMGKAMDDSPFVAEILLERALKVSGDPSKEAVLLVAHGPEEEEDDRLWLTHMEKLGMYVKSQGRFAALAVATLQDDAPDPLRQRATQRLRDQVAHLSRSYRVLVIPLLVSQDGIEGKIEERLKGLSYVYRGETLLPHEGISRWLREQVGAMASLRRPQPTGRKRQPQ